MWRVFVITIAVHAGNFQYFSFIIMLGHTNHSTISRRTMEIWLHVNGRCKFVWSHTLKIHYCNSLILQYGAPPCPLLNTLNIESNTLNFVKILYWSRGKYNWTLMGQANYASRYLVNPLSSVISSLTFDFTLSASRFSLPKAKY